MATVTVRPNGIYQADAGWTLVGGAASFQAALSDDLDTTYAQSTSTIGPLISVEMGTVAPPALAQYRSVTCRIRCSSVSGPWLTDGAAVEAGGVRGSYDQVNWTTTITTYTGAARTTAPNGAAWTQALIDEMRLVFHKSMNLIGQSVYELYADVVYNEAPVVVVTAPTGTVSNTSQPGLAWTYTDPEGDNEERIRVKIFPSSVYSAAGFNPETSTGATWDSGEVLTAGTIWNPIPAALPNNTTYRCYIKAADVGSGGRYSNWAFSTFTVLVDSPAAPTLTATADNTLARVLLTASGRDNLLTLNQSTVETGTVGFVGLGNVTAGNIVRDTAQFRQGISSLRITATAAADSRVGTLTGTTGAPAVAGQTYTGMVSIRPAANRTCYAELAWWDAADVQIGATVLGTGVAPGAGAWTDRTVTAVAPALTANVSVHGVVAGMAAAEQAWLDQWGIFPGTPAAWTRGGFVVDLGRLADSYNRADSATTLATADVGGAWAALAGTWGTISNKGYLASATADAVAVLTSTALSDGGVQADITLSATTNRANAGLVFRAVDNSNYLVFTLGKTATLDTIALYKKSAGSFTLLGSLGGLGFVNGSTYTARVEFFGGTVRMYINGVLRLTTALSAADLAAFGNNSKYGLYVNVGAAVDDGGSRFDNFTAGAPKAQTAVIERSVDSGVTWTAVRGVGTTPGATSAVQTLSAYDYELVRGVAAQYRAQIQVTTGGVILASPYSASAAATLASTGWWLKDPVAPALNMVIEVSRFGYRRKKPQQVYEPLGATSSLVVHDGVRGIVGTIETYTKSAARYTKLEALLATGRTLFLEDVLGRAWYVQVGEAMEWSLMRAQPDVGETSPIRHFHTVSLPFTEVGAPSGQVVADGVPTG